MIPEYIEGYELHLKQECSGSDVNVSVVANYEICAENCSATETCHAFAYNSYSRECHIKDRCDSSSLNFNIHMNTYRVSGTCNAFYAT